MVRVLLPSRIMQQGAGLLRHAGGASEAGSSPGNELLGVETSHSTCCKVAQLGQWPTKQGVCIQEVGCDYAVRDQAAAGGGKVCVVCSRGPSPAASLLSTTSEEYCFLGWHS